MPQGNGIPTAPGGTTAPPSGTGSGSNSGGGGSGGGGGSSTGSTSSGSGGGGHAYGSAGWYAAQQRKADREASRRYLDQAATLQQQIDALRVALGKKGFKKALDVALRNVRVAKRTGEQQLRLGYRERVGTLEQAAEDNEKTAAGQTAMNLMNRSRERANAVSEATLQGAGESDLLRTQQMSLRNWAANQFDLNSNFRDSRTSINSSLADLTVDTRTALVSNAQQANDDREQLWATYYDQRSETLTALGNALGQQAEYYGLAHEAMSGQGSRKKQKRASAASGNAFEQASLAAGQAWKDPGVSRRLRKWDGAADFEGSLNNSKFASAATELAPERPEGSSLREW